MNDFETQSREQARACGRVGWLAFSRAFNTEDVPGIEWRYNTEVNQRFKVLCAELLMLIEEGSIEVNPHHPEWSLARDARNNLALQKLIRKASRKTPIRGPKANR